MHPVLLFESHSNWPHYLLFLHIITDSESLVKAVEAIRNIARANLVFLNSSPSPENIIEFSSKIMYKYSKAHKYADVLQSILNQILIREAKGYKVEFKYVYSHLLDHIKDPSKKPYHSPEEIKIKMGKMKDKYG